MHFSKLIIGRTNEKEVNLSHFEPTIGAHCLGYNFSENTDSNNSKFDHRFKKIEEKDYIFKTKINCAYLSQHFKVLSLYCKNPVNLADDHAICHLVSNGFYVI